VQYADFLLGLDFEALAENLQVDPGSYISLLNTVARTAGHGLTLAGSRKETTHPLAPLAAAPNRTDSDQF
jgi:hypothetical protein